MGKLTANEERAILKDLRELQTSLPMIKEINEIDSKVKVFRDQKKAVGGKIKKLIDEKNEITDKIDEVKEKNNKEKVEKNITTSDKKEERTKHPLTHEIEGIKGNID